MERSSLFGRGAQEIANVAAVPRRSPFRYPGGKTWLIPCLRLWLSGKNPRPSELLEPFAGGGTISLTAAFEELAEQVTMVELDEQVAAVWTVILGEPSYARELADRIVRFELTPESVRAVLDSPGDSLVDRAFATILKNRVNRGGILARRAGLVKNGERGKGLSSRWYPATLERRILEIGRLRDRITFMQGDGVEALRENADRPEIVAFIDPPYTVASRRLYTHWEMDHEELFSMVNSFAGDFLMTYDDDERIRALAAEYGLETALVTMRSTHHVEMTELLIGRDLSWLRVS